MDILLFVVKYGLIVALAIEATIVGRALIGMVVERAQAAATPTTAEE